MEHSGSSLPSPACLLPFQDPLLSVSRHVHHLPRELYRPRVSDELHYQETPRLWIRRYDAPIAYCGSPAIQVLPGEDDPQSKHQLLPYRTRTKEKGTKEEKWARLIYAIEHILLAVDDLRSRLCEYTTHNFSISITQLINVSWQMCALYVLV